MKTILLCLSLVFSTIIVTFGQNPLPRNFEGDSILTIVKRASEAKEYYLNNKPVLKDDFETTEQFNKRKEGIEKLNAEKEQYLKGGFVSVINYQTFTYDADSKKLSIQTAFTGLSSLEFAISIGSKSSTEKYWATNAFGLKKEVTKISSESYQLIFITTEETAPVMGVDLEMDIDKARELKPNLRTALFFELEYPFLEGRLIASKATFDNPYESSDIYTKIFARAKKVLFFNQKSGEVLAIKTID